MHYCAQILGEFMSTHNNVSQNNDYQSLPLKVSVFDTDEMQRRKENVSFKSNAYRNLDLYLSYLEGTDGLIDLMPVTRFMLDELMNLALSFPNFTEVIEFYSKQISLQLLKQQPVFSADHVLIVGEGGVGKTAFCYELARIISTPFVEIAFSTATAGFVLSGTSPSWAEGRPGRIVESMAVNKTANILLMCDEIDKAGGDHRYNPLGALYQLLEHKTAKNFIDEGLETKVDCSNIVWIATANNPEYLSEPMLSRFTTFNVQSPTPEQMGAVIRSIYKNILEKNEWGVFFDSDLSSCAVDKIIESQIAPRKIQKEIKSACAQMALNHVLSKKKYRNKFKVSAKHLKLNAGVQKMSIGFY